VRDGAVIGEGFHAELGSLHAERAALEDCRERGEGGLRLVFAATHDQSEGLAVFGGLVRIDSLARPMQAAEIAQYVFERLYRARGSDALRARLAAALEAIGEVSGGIPRAVNTACQGLAGRPSLP
jgi:hypothetical protein